MTVAVVSASPNQYAGAAGKTFAQKSAENFMNPGRRLLHARMALLPRDLTLADIGCGPGQDLHAYDVMRFKKMLGVEKDPASCARAATLLGSRAHISCGTFEALPLADQSIDILTARYVMHYVENAERTILEAARVLKPGGHLLFIIPEPEYDERQTDNHNGDGSITHTLFDKALSITYPLHTREEYLGDAFMDYFDLNFFMPHPSPTLDGSNGENCALFVHARRDHTPFPALCV